MSLAMANRKQQCSGKMQESREQRQRIAAAALAGRAAVRAKRQHAEQQKHASSSSSASSCGCGCARGPRAWARAGEQPDGRAQAAAGARGRGLARTAGHSVQCGHGDLKATAYGNGSRPGQGGFGRGAHSELGCAVEEAGGGPCWGS